MCTPNLFPLLDAHKWHFVLEIEALGTLSESYLIWVVGVMYDLVITGDFRADDLGPNNR